MLPIWWPWLEWSQANKGWCTDKWKQKPTDTHRDRCRQGQYLKAKTGIRWKKNILWVHMSALTIHYSEGRMKYTFLILMKWPINFINWLLLNNSILFYRYNENLLCYHKGGENLIWHYSWWTMLHKYIVHPVIQIIITIAPATSQ